MKNVVLLNKKKKTGGKKLLARPVLTMIFNKPARTTSLPCSASNYSTSRNNRVRSRRIRFTGVLRIETGLRDREGCGASFNVP